MSSKKHKKKLSKKEQKKLAKEQKKSKKFREAADNGCLKTTCFVPGDDEFTSRVKFSFGTSCDQPENEEARKDFVSTLGFYDACLEYDGFDTPLLHRNEEVLIELASAVAAFAFKPERSSGFECDVADAVNELLIACLLYMHYEVHPSERTLWNLFSMIHMENVRLDNPEYSSPLAMLFRELETGEVWDGDSREFVKVHDDNKSDASVWHYRRFQAHPGLVRVAAVRAAENAILKLLLLVNR